MSKLSHRADENGRSNNTDVNARLNTIENLLTRLISSIPQAIASRPFAGDTGSPDVSSLTASGEEIFHPHATPPDPAPRVAMPHKPPPSGLFPSNMSYTTPTSRTGYGWGLREGRRISLSLDDNFELRDMLQTLKESGVSQGHLEWLIAGVPGRRMADGLVELYFRYVIFLIGRMKVRALTITQQGYRVSLESECKKKVTNHITAGPGIKSTSSPSCRGITSSSNPLGETHRAQRLTPILSNGSPLCSFLWVPYKFSDAMKG